MSREGGRRVDTDCCPVVHLSTLTRTEDDTTMPGVPGAGYRCKHCGLEGGKPNSHWHQSCPTKPPQVVEDVVTPNNPGVGYKCNVCGQPGGLPESHWHQRCPMQARDSRGCLKRPAEELHHPSKHARHAADRHEVRSFTLMTTPSMTDPHACRAAVRILVQ